MTCSLCSMFVLFKYDLWLFIFSIFLLYMFETFALYNLLLVICIWFYTYNTSIRTYVLFIYLFIYSLYRYG